MDQIAQVITFWRDEVGPAGWYNSTPALDETIRSRFHGLWQQARAGQLESWSETAEGALALLIVIDQFPRNMFRDQPESFVTDHMAQSEAQAAISRGYDMVTPVPMRQFFYLPLMHAEDIVLQRRAIRMFEDRMPGDNIRHARAHAAIIARFGRFPWRNAALGRETTPAEQEFMANGGYAGLLNSDELKGSEK